MRETGIPEGAPTVTLDLQMLVYVRGREDPINFLGSFCFQRAHLEEEVDDDGDPTTARKSFMDIAGNTVKSVLLDRSAPLAVLSDRNESMFIIQTDEIQGVSLLAPAPNTIMDAMEEEQ
jgi:hypothetical protein